MLFTYWDNSEAWHGKMIYQCQTKRITDADALLLKYTGIDPVKSKFVSCVPTNDNPTHVRNNM